jgi:MFS family permease
MISHAGRSIGQGWVFGLNEALDQGGATVGPLLTALVLYLRGGYHHAFALLLIPALLCLAVLALARVLYPRPHELEERTPKALETHGFSRTYWTYVAAGALIAAGFADFSLMAFHFRRARIVSEDVIPVFYAVAMVTSALASLAIGRLLDRVGRPVIISAVLAAMFSPALVFFGGAATALAGVILWGIGVGAQDSALKPLLVGVIPAEKRGTAFGVFDTGFGMAWFAGSVAMGLLYEKSLTALVVFSIALQFAAVPVLLATRKAPTGD